MQRNNIVKTLLLSTRYLRLLCDEYCYQSDCIINGNAEVMHKMARHHSTFVIFRNFLSGNYCNFNEKSAILKG